MSTPRFSDTAPVRPGEELNVESLTEYLCGRLGEGALAVEQFPGGHSNLTYLIRIGRREYVLRRAPFGPVPPKAHDMAREYHLLDQIHPHFAGAPAVYLLCEDSTIIGSPFFVMERRRGIVIRGSGDVPHDPTFAGRVSRGFLDTLVELHAIDIHRYGLVSLGKPEGFLERQVKGWAERWQRAKTLESVAMDSVISWLAANRPVSPPPTIVHNDYKLDNVMLNTDDPERVEAVLDWEMTTVGDPLADLGLTLCYWTLGGAYGMPGGEGWFTRDEIVNRYADATGRDVSNLNYYEILGIFKLAVILQQIYFRYVNGQTRDERFRTFGTRVQGLIDNAHAKLTD
jgi:aminoglycoside phosphotransferase (APT) family kinase protein